MKRITLLVCFSVPFALAGDSLFDTSSSTAVNLIRSHGFPVEEHSVQTEDGYILLMHRIPKANGSVVFLQHGLLSSSGDWLIIGPQKALAFVLSNQGYDVWMGNARGNTYSRKHKTLSPESSDFWNFDWHEIALYDIPAMINYILNKTKQRKLNYVGHSQGTTVYFILNSKKPKFGEKFRSAHLLAPVAYMGNMKSPYMKLFAPILGEPGTIPDSLTSFEFLPNNQPMEILAKSLCNERSKFLSFCAYSLFLIGGFNELNLNASLIPEIAKVAPAGSSFRQILHYFQEHLSGKFREWDYGPKKNKEVYGKDEPPEYPVDKIRAPTHFYYSKNDFMSSDVDVEKLAKKMKKEYVRELYLIPDHKFTHLDYLYGLNSKKVVYDRIVYNLKKFYKCNPSNC